MSPKIEKTISWLLRHGAVKENIDINEQGYVLISDLLSWLKLRNIDISLDELLNIVNNDTKGRLSILNDSIRACQGHSINLKISFKKYTQGLGHIIHATYKKNYCPILNEGIKAMTRDFVHLINIDSNSDKFHMIRQDVDLYIFVDGHSLDLRISENGVILTPHILPQYLTFVPAFEHQRSGCYGFIVYDTTKTKVLVVETKSGIFGFPKGKKNKGELSICCAFRELKEETNLDPEDIKVLSGCKSEINENNNVPTNYYLAQIRENIVKDLYCVDQEENLKLHWMTISDIIKIKDCDK